MDQRGFRLHDGQRGLALAVRVRPGAEKNAIDEITPDGTIIVSLAVLDDESKINQSLVNFLAEVLQAPAGRIEIIAGGRGKDKLVTVMDLNVEEAQERLQRKTT